MSAKSKPSESGSTTAKAAEAESAKRDVMLVHGVSEDGKSLAVIRARDDKLEAGVVRAIADGEPMHGEVVRLTPRPACPVLCDVEVTVPRGLLNAPGGADSSPSAARAANRTGPAQVATDRYRDNWDAIWPGRTKGERPN